MSQLDKIEAFEAAVRRWKDRINDNSLIIGQLEFLALDNPARPDHILTQALCLRRESEALGELIVETKRQLRLLNDN